MNGYYDGLISFLETTERQGFTGGLLEKRLLLEDRAGVLIDQMTDAFESDLEVA